MVAGAIAASSAAEAQDEEISIYFVGCAAPTGFHGYLARGAAEAGENLGVSVTYIYPDQLTIPNQVQKIEEAIAAQADGIAICVFTEDAAYADVVARAKEAGIAVGSAAAPPPGTAVRDPEDMFLFRTGSDEGAAGKLTAQRLISMGVTGRVVVANQQPGDASCQLRATSQIEALKEAGIEAEFLELTMDPGQQAESLFNYLRLHPDTAAATSTCDVIDGFLAAKEQSGRDDLILTGYDIVAQSLAAIRDGRQSFTIDQQQFWRGYMPVVLLTHNIKYGLLQANYFLTGPTIVDKDNVEKVAGLVEKGYR
jgi:simple sugar transport system substrate-binding protein